MTGILTTYRSQGWVVLPDPLSPGWVSRLSAVCDQLLNAPVFGDAAHHDLDLGSRRRFLRHSHTREPDVKEVLLEGPLGQAARRLIGETCFLFNEQFVVKGAEHGSSFAWHQDGVYVDIPHRTYLSLWVALDDANEENGCLYLLDRNLDKNEMLTPHVWNDEMRERVGYHGSDSGRPILAPLGTVVAFSSATMHRSGKNRTAAKRRAFLAQYSCEPILDPQTGKPRNFAKPVPS